MFKSREIQLVANDANPIKQNRLLFHAMGTFATKINLPIHKQFSKNIYILNLY
jgi:hypothetical protein